MKSCGEYKHCWHQVGELCKEEVRYEGVHVYMLVMCCNCMKTEKQSKWD